MSWHILHRAIEPRIARRPTHPGELFRDIVLPELNLSISEAARQLGVSRQTLHAIMAAQSAVTAEMALRFGKFCDNGPGLWMRMQQAFDLWEAQRRNKGARFRANLKAKREGLE